MSLVLYYIYRDIPSRKRMTQQLIISTLLKKKKTLTNNHNYYTYNNCYNFIK